MSNSIIVAVDEFEVKKFYQVIDQLDPRKCMVKIGSISFNSMGHEIIHYASDMGFEVFLDLKLHDIPNTVEKSIKGLSILPISMLTIHVSGGMSMLKAAMEGVHGTDIKVIGVTALTSLSDDDTNSIYKRNSSEHVKAMLEHAESSGIHGVVCSPHELNLVNQKESLISITPGIRYKESKDDQKRTMSPAEAINLGADYIVIGRPITGSNNIEDSLNKIYESIK